MRRITNLTSDSAPESRSDGDRKDDGKEKKDKKVTKDKTDPQTKNPDSLPTLQWTPPPSSISSNDTSSPNNDNFHNNPQLLLEAHKMRSNDEEVIEVFASEIEEATPAQTVRSFKCKLATIVFVLVIILGSIAAFTSISIINKKNGSNSEPTSAPTDNCVECYPDLTSPTFDKSQLCEHDYCSCYLKDAELSEDDNQYYYASICLGPEGNCTKPHLYYDLCVAPTEPPESKPPLGPGMEGDCTKSICYPDLDAPDFSSDQLCACYCYTTQKDKYMEYDRECIRSR